MAEHCLIIDSACLWKIHVLSLLDGAQVGDGGNIEGLSCGVVDKVVNEEGCLTCDGNQLPGTPLCSSCDQSDQMLLGHRLRS